jgi:elongation factor G
MDKNPDLSHTRYIGIAAHVDAGKTTLTERILFYTGASHKVGEVHDGAAHMDYLAEEKAHGITISSAVTRTTWEDHRIQIVDTPGHVDFSVEVERTMRVLDGCIVVLDGVRGVEPQTETVWRQRTKFALPALFFINKMDRPGADLRRAMESIHQRLGAEPVPVTVPLPDEGAVIHLIDKQVIRFDGTHGEVVRQEPVDDASWEAVAEFRENLLLAAAEADDSLTDLVLADKEPSAEALWRALRRATLAGTMQPCFTGSALRNQGVQPLLDGVVRLLPSPLDRPPLIAVRPDGGAETIAVGDDGPLVALAFKVQMWDGRRHVYVRIYRNRLRPGDSVAILRPDGRHLQEQVARLFDVDANRKTRVDAAVAGQIVLLAGLRHATTGDTLCDPKHMLALERIEAREPVLSLSVEPASSEDEEKFLDILEKLQQEDPTLRVEENPETGQRLLHGMGELHLQILLERLQREFHLRVRTGSPAVAMRETITKPAAADVLFQPALDSSQTQAEIKARVVVAVAPRERGAGITIQCQPQVIPAGRQLSPPQSAAIEEGVRLALGGGPSEGAPLDDLEVVVGEIELFGKASTEEALRAAAAKAVVNALKKADHCVLYPIMATEIVVPEENLGVVLGDLQSRHAVILGTDNWKGTVTVFCEINLNQLLGYTTNLRSMTQGRGQFSTTFKRFDRV